MKSLLDLSLTDKEKLITKIKISHSSLASDCALVVFIIHKQKKPHCLCVLGSLKVPAS